jgi:hypothetical protein
MHNLFRLVWAPALATLFLGPASPTVAQCSNCPVSTNALGDVDLLNGYLVSTRQPGSTRGGAFYLKNFDVFGNRGTYSLFSLNYNGAESYFQLRAIDSATGPRNLLQAYSFGHVRFPAGNVTVEGGNFGIGSFDLGAPGQMLELMRTGSDVAVRFHLSGVSWFTAGIKNGAGGRFFLNRGPDPGSVNDLTIDAGSGNVGLGTANAPDRLTVNGAVTVGTSRVIDATGKWVGDPTGLVGPQGPAGPQGPVGPQGPPGPSVGTIAVCAACGSAACDVASGWITASAGDAPCTAVAGAGSCSITTGNCLGSECVVCAKSF